MTRSIWLWPLTIILSSAATAALVFGDIQSPLRTIVALWFLAMCPGMAIIRLMRLRSRSGEHTLGLGLSLAFDAIIAISLLFAGVWSPKLGLLILIGVSVGGAILQLSRPLLTRLVLSRRFEASAALLVQRMLVVSSLLTVAAIVVGGSLFLTGPTLVSQIAEIVKPTATLPRAPIVPRTPRPTAIPATRRPTAQSTTFLSATRVRTPTPLHSATPLPPSHLTDTPTPIPQSTPTPVSQSTPTAAPQATPTAVTSTVLVFDRILQKGIKGSNVALLQRRLRELNYFDYPELTGYYGDITAKGVAQFQRARGLPATGMTDKATITALNQCTIECSL